MSLLCETNYLIQKIYISKSLVSLDYLDRSEDSVYAFLLKNHKEELRVGLASFCNGEGTDIFFNNLVDSSSQLWGTKDSYGKHWWVSTNTSLINQLLKEGSYSIDSSLFTDMTHLKRSLSFLYGCIDDRNTLSLVKGYKAFKVRLNYIDVEEVYKSSSPLFKLWSDYRYTTTGSTMDDVRTERGYKVRSLIFSSIDLDQDITLSIEDYCQSWFIV